MVGLGAIVAAEMMRSVGRTRVLTIMRPRHVYACSMHACMHAARQAGQPLPQAVHASAVRPKRVRSARAVTGKSVPAVEHRSAHGAHLGTTLTRTSAARCLGLTRWHRRSGWGGGSENLPSLSPGQPQKGRPSSCGPRARGAGRWQQTARGRRPGLS